jgi:iron complex outermembrane receptor protein
MIYLFFYGFKAGGVNPTVPPSLFPSDLGKVFGPEQIDTYEAGFKNTFFDRRVQVSTAVFYNDYKSLQTSTNGNINFPAIILAIVNAGTARAYGAEGSVAWRAAEPLTLSANVAYLNAKYKNFKNADGSVLNLFDFSHQRMIFSPKWQVSFSGELDQPLNDEYHLIAHALVSHTSRVRAGLSTVPGVPDPTIAPYWITNVRLGLRTADERYEISAFANNLFNEGYQTFGSFSAALGSNLVWGNPRIVGVELNAKFR